MGEADSNPVLEVIPSGAAVVEAAHYPDPWLGFAGGPIRAYYHCHPQPSRIAGEHGHFHLFIEAVPGHWTHLGALSMDPQGQLRALFATNRWVTDEHWLTAKELRQLSLPKMPTSGLLHVESWLLALLHLLHPRFIELWDLRDRRLSGIIESRTNEGILENREYYVLAQLSVDLLSELQGALLGQTT